MEAASGDASRASFVQPMTPGSQYGPFRDSLAGQLQTTRQNLLSSFDNEEGTPRADRATSDDGDDERILTFLRVRPSDDADSAVALSILDGKRVTVDVEPPKSVSGEVSTHSALEFTFSRVFPPETTQVEMFDKSTKGLVDGALQGRSGLLFSYGVTNSGKTFTIQGTREEPGLIPRALEALFAEVAQRGLTEIAFKPAMFNSVVRLDGARQRDADKLRADMFALDGRGDDAFSFGRTSSQSSLSESSLGSSVLSLSDASTTSGSLSRVQEASCVDASGRLLVFASFVEIYNDRVFDLLNPHIGDAKTRPQLKLTEDCQSNTYIKDAREVCVFTADEALKLLRIGQRVLSFASTKLNYSSSRRLCFCDLAGSERASKTQNEGARLRETASINTSLMILGRCIERLRAHNGRDGIAALVPFRETKLTRVLQNFLMGKGRTRMIVNVNPSPSCQSETMHVLKFSTVVKQVKLRKNEDETRKMAQLTQVLLAQLSQVLPSRRRSSRHTMQWETAREGLPDAADDDDTDSADGDDDDGELDVTVREEELVQFYTSRIQRLQEQIVAERQKHLEREQEIRNEVCDTFANQMRQQSRRDNERHVEEVMGNERLAENRINLYVDSARKQLAKQSAAVAERDAADDETDDDEAQWVDVRTFLECKQAKEKADNCHALTLMKVKDLELALAEATAMSDQAEHEADYGAALQQIHQLTKRCDDSEEMLREAGEKFQLMQNEIDEKDRQIVALRSQLAQVGATVGFLRQSRGKSEDLVSFEKQIRNLQADPLEAAHLEVEAKYRLITALRQELSNLKTKMEYKKKLSSELDMIEETTQMFDLEQAVQKERDAAVVARRDAEDASARAAAADQRADDLRRQLEQLGDVQAALERVEADLAAARVTADTQLAEATRWQEKCEQAEAETERVRVDRDQAAAAAVEAAETAQRQSQDELGQASARLDRLQAETDALRQALDVETKRLASAVALASEEEKTRRDCQKQLKSTKEELKTLDNEKLQVIDAKQTVEKELNASIAKLADSTRELALLSASAKNQKEEGDSQLRFFEQRIEHLRADVRSREVELSANQQEIAELKKRAVDVVALQGKLVESEEHVSQLTIDLENQQGMCATLQSDLEKQRAVVESVKAAKSSSEEELSSEADRLRQQLAATANDSEAARRERDRLSTDLTAAREQLVQKETDLDEREAVVTELKKQLAEQDASQQKLEELLATRNSTIAQLRDKEAQLRQSMERLESDLAQREDEADGFAADRNRLEEERDVEKQEACLLRQELNSSHAKLESVLRQIGGDRGDHLDLKLRITELEQELDSSRTQLAALGRSKDVEAKSDRDNLAKEREACHAAMNEISRLREQLKREKSARQAAAGVVSPPSNAAASSSSALQDSADDASAITPPPPKKSRVDSSSMEAETNSVEVSPMASVSRAAVLGARRSPDVATETSPESIAHASVSSMSVGSAQSASRKAASASRSSARGSSSATRAGRSRRALASVSTPIAEAPEAVDEASGYGSSARSLNPRLAKTVARDGIKATTMASQMTNGKRPAAATTAAASEESLVDANADAAPSATSSSTRTKALKSNLKKKQSFAPQEDMKVQQNTTMNLVEQLTCSTKKPKRPTKK